MAEKNPVHAWTERIVIPTYVVPPPDPSPMFFEKRVYQGSSGKVYPNPFTERVSDEKTDKPYDAVFLENEYLKLTILPEIGGRIYRGLDKTNGYDFFYRQTVIKPALVGLLGPWISGGVEFNWPQHHRPTTFMPVDYAIERHSDGSATVWLGEHEPMNRMKGMVGISLEPGKAVVEAKVQLYNRTPFIQTFLWWANAAVHVHDRYEAFFPPDVTCVADHAKRAICEFPVARGTYYGVDYSPGTDIRWYKNIPVPTSYMVTESRYDFFGGYDHAREAGVVHVADHHIAPGKKLWTWGNAEFGYAWDRELTDSDGPYIELMAGVYTDNQPDFSWLEPYETKRFVQYWYPIQRIGPAKNANRFAAVNLEVTGRKAKVGLCVTKRFEDARVVLRAGEKIFFERETSLSPEAPWVDYAELPEGVAEHDLLLTVLVGGGRELIRYQPEKRQERTLPSPAAEPPLPEEALTTEDLYLIGLHLEQYRHATRRPETYWQEALRRDPDDSRNNNALGVLSLRRGQFEEAEQHFRNAIRRLTRWNPNPYDGEVFYNLGLALEFEGRPAEAYDAFYKATWNGAWQAAGYFALARIDSQRGDWPQALEHLEQSLSANAQNTKAQNLKTAALRKLGRIDEAEALALQTIAFDPLDSWSRNELVLAQRARRDHEAASRSLRDLRALMRDQAQTYLDLAFDYSSAGLWKEAIDLLERLLNPEPSPPAVYPMVLYTLRYLRARDGNPSDTLAGCERAATMPSACCFPSRLEEMRVLKWVLAQDPRNAGAHYYLGNLLYDKERYDEAIESWTHSSEIDPAFPTSWRNLGIAYYNVRHDRSKAAAAYKRAFDANPDDARLLYEMDQLSKRLGEPASERLAALEARVDLVNQRDDLTLERVTLYNQTGQSERALEILLNRRFHPWEGGEGLVSGAYVWARVLLGRKCLDAGRPREALVHFEAARRYPENLGEGKHRLTPENHLNYFIGVAEEALNDGDARASFARAAEAPSGYSPANYYQALALRSLGQHEVAQSKLEGLLEFAKGKIKEKAEIGYFATSLPNFLLFDDDLQVRHRVDCLFLIGLAGLGLGRQQRAEGAFREILALDPNHLGALEEFRRISGSISTEGALATLDPQHRP